MTSRDHLFSWEIMTTVHSSSAQQTVNGVRSLTRHPWLTAAGTAAVIAAVAQLAARARRHQRVSRDRRDWTGRQNLDRRIAAEFTEMPGMTLTLAQAGRLFGMPIIICERVLGTLITGGVLRYTKAGQYVRAETGEA
jgi:hypothetical protein